MWPAGGHCAVIIPHTAHIAAYRITNRTLEIIAFIHESQQWPDHL